MSLASAIYSGTVAHRRLRPRQHSLKYRAFWMLLDLDELPALDRSFKRFSYNRFNLFSFHDRDHGDSSDKPLRQWVEGHLKDAGIATDGGPIRLLCLPRILGYVFNPISVYFCYLGDGTLNAILYEVNNTFGQRHSYLIPVEANGRRMIEQSCSKRLYVSPFNDMNMSYAFKVQSPEASVTVGVDALDPSGLMITTSLHGKRAEFTDRAMISAFLGHPLLTLKVIVAIHWEALRLWLKGMKITDRPPGPETPVSLGSGAAGK
ncbi:MAG TPA: DUF1365 family protein [Alphaproteobacteria bacterium]|jgi:hypothetical protein|nr:DUF1365 family protein [Alphaproteobacteria bacterium]